MPTNGRARPGGNPARALRKSTRSLEKHTSKPRYRQAHRIDFDRVNAVALAALLPLLRRWLPEGALVGREYVARNPRRFDRHLGSFRINVESGRWADFAVADARGGDVVSLAAYVHGLSQSAAARRLADMLGVEADHE